MPTISQKSVNEIHISCVVVLAQGYSNYFFTFMTNMGVSYISEFFEKMIENKILDWTIDNPACSQILLFNHFPKIIHVSPVQFQNLPGQFQNSSSQFSKLTVARHLQRSQYPFQDKIFIKNLRIAKIADLFIGHPGFLHTFSMGVRERCVPTWFQKSSITEHPFAFLLDNLFGFV